MINQGGDGLTPFKFAATREDISPIYILSPAGTIQMKTFLTTYGHGLERDFDAN
jgi:hypothetical protein